MSKGDIKHQMLEELRELNGWMKLRSREELKEAIRSEERDEIDLVLIDEADGEKTIRDFVEVVPLSYTPTYQRLKKLGRLGVIRKNSEEKWIRLSSLEELGIERPELDIAEEDDGNDEE